jgi:predicted phage terminase large subunit-like protein
MDAVVSLIKNPYVSARFKKQLKTHYAGALKLYNEEALQKERAAARKTRQAAAAKTEAEVFDNLRRLTFPELFALIQRQGFFADRITGEPYAVTPRQLEWIALYAKQAKVSALLASRGKGKTQVAVIAAVVWQLIANPQLTFAVVSRVQQKSLDIVRNIKLILAALGVSSGRSERVVRLSRCRGVENSVDAYATEGIAAIRGYHYDFVIMDDPLAASDYHSKSKQTMANNAFDEVLNVAAKDGHVVVISQLISQNDFVFTRIKASNTVYLMESWLGDIPQLEVPLAVLEQEHSKNDIARNYLGNLELTNERPYRNILVAADAPEGRVLCVIDPAKKTGDDSDSTALALIWRTAYGRLMILGHSWPVAYEECLTDLTAVAKMAHEVYYEDNSSGTALQLLFKQAGIYCKGFTTTSKKEARIMRYKADAAFELFALSAHSSPAFIEAVRSWSLTAAHDDEADVMAMAIDIWYQRTTGKRQVR